MLAVLLPSLLTPLGPNAFGAFLAGKICRQFSVSYDDDVPLTFGWWLQDSVEISEDLLSLLHPAFP